ncbi:MAG: arginine--tRNA ligase [Arenicella sp.]
MKQELQPIFAQAVEQLQQEQLINVEQLPEVKFERTRQKEHGDFATNIALMLAKAAKMNPRDLAQKIVDALPPSDIIEKVDIAGPGFINIFVVSDARFAVIDKVLRQAERYGLAEHNSQKHKVMIEYVSANPTGPLHVGHGRGAAYGDALSRLLIAAGYDVHKEYYVNDAGRQMDILATSLWLRYVQACSVEFTFPENAYQGDYVVEMAEQQFARHGDAYSLSAGDINSAQQGLEAEEAIDALIALAKQQLADVYEEFFQLILSRILDDIRDDLAGFGVEYNEWFSERSLFAAKEASQSEVDQAIAALKETEYLYEKGGALWFQSTALGDEKDRVVVRDNGTPTYFASDIAYHLNKYQRGFDTCINIWGADHHGYVPRVKAALQALGQNPDKLVVLLVQFAILYRGGEKVSMSTRSGQFVTLRELRDEVGTDAARFYYVQRKPEQHMDFDLDLAKSQSNDNPVYYVQYAHARICRVFETAIERGIDVAKASEFSGLTLEIEESLLTLLAKFPEVVINAARVYEPHQVTYYLRDLANGLHSYYNACKFLDSEPELRAQRFSLLTAVQQVLHNGLNLLGVNAPEKM